LLLTSGTGIPRGFYRRFAAFAADSGFLVLTFDYRGTGDSAPSTLKGCGIVYRDWGQLDVPVAAAWLREQAPDLALGVVGHSTGGQQLGLSPVVEDVDAALFIAVSTGYWAGMPTRVKWFTFVLWKLFVPLSGRVFGYFPSSHAGLGEDLPIGVAKAWGAWCFEPTYLGAFLDGTGHRTSPDGRPFGPAHFADATVPRRALYFPDDTSATPANAPPLLALYDQAAVETHWVAPSDWGLSKIGHSGFFRSHSAVLWADELAWLRARAAGSDATAS
jgi:predicted alpha/beta hydrolase